MFRNIVVFLCTLVQSRVTNFENVIKNIGTILRIGNEWHRKINLEYHNNIKVY